MKDFNLKKALAGEKVVTVDGDEVTQLKLLSMSTESKLVGVHMDRPCVWDSSGKVGHDTFNPMPELQLKMAPDTGEGFLHVYDDEYFILDDKKCTNLGDPIMIFDLSKYPIGFGLDE
jgi:hypothetical protein